MAGRLKNVGVSPGLTRGKNGAKSGITQVQGGENQINKQETRWGSVFGQSKGMPNTTLNKYSGHKEGGKIMATKLFGGKESKTEEMREAKALRAGAISPKEYIKGEKSEGHKEENLSKTAKAIKSGKMSPAAYAKSETNEPKGMKCGGGVKKMAKGGGCEVKGKTKGKMIVMKKGGAC